MTQPNETTLFDEDEVVRDTVRLFANREQIPKFMRLVPGIGPLLEPLRLAAGMIVDRKTAEPVLSMSPASEAIPAPGSKSASLLRALQQDFREDLAAIVEGRLSRAAALRIKAESSRVRKIVPGDQDATLPAKLEIPDPDAMLGFVLGLLLNNRYRKRLAKCKLDECDNFFLREARQSHPKWYCCPSHAKRGNAGPSAASRAKDYRARQKAIKVLGKKYPSRAEKLVTEVSEPGLTVEQLVKRAEIAAGSRKHK